MNKMGIVKNKPQTKYYKKNRAEVLLRIKKRNDKRKEEKTFQCKECDKTYTDNRNLQKHLNGSRHAKKISNISYNCKICKYSTKYKQNYNTHLKSKKHSKNSHNSEKPDLLLNNGRNNTSSKSKTFDLLTIDNEEE